MTGTTLFDEPRAPAYSLVSSANTVESGTVREKHRNVKGMGFFVTCLFVVGETAGGGLIALPNAIVNAGLFGGLSIILLVAVACAYTGAKLSENWTILQHRWPEYKEHCRKPYPAMAHRSLGARFGTAVSACLNVTQFGTACVFLLLGAQNIESFLQVHGGITLGFCKVLLCVAVFMLPFTLLKSPKDFWWAVIFAMVTTTVAVALIIYGAVEDYDVCSKNLSFPEFSFGKVFMAFGTVMFAYGGHGAFPTIQHDMKKPYLFAKSVVLAFIIICSMYIPVSLVGYYTYGGSLTSSIIPSLQNSLLQQTVNMLITIHVVLALTIVFNPLNQEFEDYLEIPHHFGWQRVAARSTVMVAVVIMAETVPNFGVLLDLVGGSTITLMALIFPCVFNLYLCAGATKYSNAKALPEEETLTFSEVLRYTPSKKLFINFLVLACAIIGGGAATVSAMHAMTEANFSPPCYAHYFTGVSPVEQLPLLEEHGKFACCGTFRNISRFGLNYCLDPTVKITGGHG